MGDDGIKLLSEILEKEELTNEWTVLITWIIYKKEEVSFRITET